MDIFLNNPALLWLMALAAIPLLVHLLARSRPPEHAFSDISFLKNIVKKASRYRKPKDHLVLILRTLAAAALLFAFLHPFLTSKDPNEVVGADKNVIFVIDQSASMSAMEGSTTRFDEACNEAASIMAKLKPDNANVIWINASPDAVFPAPGPNLNFLSQQLQKAKPTSENGAASSAIKLAINQLQKLKGNREIILISDFQKQAWENAEIFVPETIKFTKLSVGVEKLPNLAIDSLTVSPSSPVIGQTVSISTRIKSFSDKPKSTSVYLNAGGGRQSREIEIPANGQSEVEFSTVFNHHGNVAVTASLTEGAFRGDDERYTIIPVRETLRLMSYFKEDTNASDMVLSRLANALPWLTHIPVKSLPGVGVCDVLFVHDWNGEDTDSLTKLSINGTSIIVTPSVSCSMESLQELLDLAPVNVQLSQTKNPQGWKAQMAKESAAVFEIFSSGEFGNPAQGSFRQRSELPKEWANTSLINYTDGVPAVLISRKPSSSRLIWNLSFDPEHSDWISQEPFVSFMAELLLNIQPAEINNDTEQLVGNPVSWILPDNMDAKTLKLMKHDGDGGELKTELVNTPLGSSLQSITPSTPGIYEWRTGSTIAHMNFINFPASESDLTLLDPDDIPSGDTADKDDIVRAEALAQGMPIWPWLLGGVFLLLVAESIAATSRHQPISDK